MGNLPIIEPSNTPQSQQRQYIKTASIVVAVLVLGSLIAHYSFSHMRKKLVAIAPAVLNAISSRISAPTIATTAPLSNTQAVAPTTNYRNAHFGISVILPAGWYVSRETNNRLFFENSSSKDFGYIEMYPFVFRSPLSELQSMLTTNVDAGNIQDITFSGRSAIEYISRSANEPAIATVSGNTLYYFHRALTTDSFKNSIGFTQKN